ncbi:hypothetical protein BJV78DRAFT_691694 [Lactifluus subvellereus]|nr:hypothetical protein BJV78DRAFT_691694 [Lactifluus subvellereus]
MLDFDPLLPAYPPYIQYNDSPFRLQAMQADPVAYNSYSPHAPALGKIAFKSPPLTPPPAFAFNPGPQSFTFDPFADEDSSTSSGASERERELEVQRLRRIEFLRRREWMRRVVAWVDGISHGMTPTSSPSPVLSKSDFTPASPSYTPPRDPADVPTLYYSSSSSLTGRSDEVDEPYHPRPHLHHLPCQKPWHLYLFIPLRFHSRIYHHLHKRHHHAAFMAVCVHSVQFVRRTNASRRFAPAYIPIISSSGEGRKRGGDDAGGKDIPLAAQSRLQNSNSFFCSCLSSPQPPPTAAVAVTAIGSYFLMLFLA